MPHAQCLPCAGRDPVDAGGAVGMFRFRRTGSRIFAALVREGIESVAELGSSRKRQLRTWEDDPAIYL